MFYYLSSALKRRLILELQDGFSRHPIYNKIVPYIQNKYSFEERPNYGIVIKGSSANKVQLAGDNFLGTVVSHVMLAYVQQPCYMLEWVREDTKLIEATGSFPSPPGIYYIQCLSAPTNPEEAGYFSVDPLLTQTNEPVLEFTSGIEREAQLQNNPVEGTLRLWENNQYLLKEDIDYSVNYSTGALTILTRSKPGSLLTADYRYLGDPIGPVAFYWNQSDFKTIPGVVLAFGKRAVAGGQVAVVVTSDRVDAANAFGGKFEVTFDMDVLAQDPIQMEEIADFAVMHIWGEKKNPLEFEGIEIVDINMGGETEETYDETGETFYYMASLSIQFRADWEIHVPLPYTMASANQTLNQIVNPDLLFSVSPSLKGRNASYERIG